MLILIGFLSGIISGMGIGGGAILIPALIIFEEVTQKTAQGVNLLYFIPTAIISLIIHIKNKNVEIRTALIIGVSGILGSIFGAFLMSWLNSDILRKMFGFFLLGIGVYEIFKGIRTPKKS